jgi:hypothetical protein
MKSALPALLSLAAIPLALSPHASLRTVTVTAHDFSLRLPDTLPEGPVTLRLVNEGKEFHHVWIARMEGGMRCRTSCRHSRPLVGTGDDIGRPYPPLSASPAAPFHALAVRASASCRARRSSWPRLYRHPPRSPTAGVRCRQDWRGS